MIRTFSVILLLLLCLNTGAQEVSFKDSVTLYNRERIATNKRGMTVLAGMGLASMAAGGVGYFSAQQDEWKHFHEMNVLWGAVNTGIAVMGLRGVRKEISAGYNYKQAYDRYRSNKKLYLINAGLDVLYIAGGIALNEYGHSTTKDQAMYLGFGRSVAIQGIALLLFDNIMFASHHRKNSKWQILMYDIRFTGNGIGFVHNF